MGSVFASIFGFVTFAFVVFIFVLWLWLLISVIGDLFRRDDVGKPQLGWINSVQLRLSTKELLRVRRR
jgi:hypothetical protein